MDALMSFVMAIALAVGSAFVDPGSGMCAVAPQQPVAVAAAEVLPAPDPAECCCSSESWWCAICRILCGGACEEAAPAPSPEEGGCCGPAGPCCAPTSCGR